LSGQKIEQLVMHRIDPDEKKKNVVDFALWKSQKPGEPAWDSPWGKGRPGWHIEDTAITTHYFGPTYDLHGGGLDLVFPHHEAEIAQAEAATGVKPLVRFWVHGGLLMIQGERMGHSMGNFVTIEETLRKHDAEALRLYYGMRHYRTQLNFDEADISQAEDVLDKLRSVYNQFTTMRDAGKLSDEKTTDPDVEQLTSGAINRFNGAMDDDFNTPRALAELIAYSKAAEAYAASKITLGSAECIIRTYNYFGSIFGILRAGSARQNLVVEKLLGMLVQMREDARRNGDWATADRIRKDLTLAGVGIEDTPSGARWYIAASNGAKKKSA